MHRLPVARLAISLIHFGSYTLQHSIVLKIIVVNLTIFLKIVKNIQLGDQGFEKQLKENVSENLHRKAMQAQVKHHTK